jgi:IS30 family transposase
VRNLSTNVRRQQIEWRRGKVLELSSNGYNQTEIGQRLQLDKSTVNRDIAFLRNQAKQDVQKHIHETVPEEYQKCMVGMKRNLKQTLEIAGVSGRTKDKTAGSSYCH